MNDVVRGDLKMQNILTDVKTAGAVTVATVGTSIGSLLDFINPIAVVISAILSLVLIYNHIKKGRLERRSLELQNFKTEQLIKKEFNIDCDKEDC